MACGAQAAPNRALQHSSNQEHSDRIIAAGNLPYYSTHGHNADGGNGGARQATGRLLPAPTRQ
jgi:hypothetical protein